MAAHNPPIDHSPQFIRAEFARMRATPVAFARPLVVLGGYHTPHFNCAQLAAKLTSLTSGRPDDANPISFLRSTRLEHAAALATRAVRERPGKDAPFDAVGISMGGIIGRALAMDGMRVVRLFTLATPHRGARIARHARPDRAAIDMRAGSAFLAALDAALAPSAVEVFPYARLHDHMVGATNAAPHGMRAMWRKGPRLLAHLTITRDDVFVLDIAEELRGEEPLTFPDSHAPHD